MTNTLPGGRARLMFLFCLLTAVCYSSPASAQRSGTINADQAGVRPSDQQPLRSTYEQHALTRDGDPHRGRQLFRDEKATKCATCHRVQGNGGDVGPDLSSIGGKFDRPHLIESLLEPSRQIVEGYRTSVIVTTDGRVETGIVKRESDTESPS